MNTEKIKLANLTGVLICDCRECLIKRVNELERNLIVSENIIKKHKDLIEAANENELKKHLADDARETIDNYMQVAASWKSHYFDTLAELNTLKSNLKELIK